MRESILRNDGTINDYDEELNTVVTPADKVDIDLTVGNINV